jgi:DNA polymerase II small subunit/DNA polymerase delta subunit B
MRAIFNLAQSSMPSLAAESLLGQNHSHNHTPTPTPIEPEDDPRNRVRAVFVSDVHLGTQGCQAEALLDFLKHHPSEYLYLVGDIVDGWQLKRRWFWPQRQSKLIVGSHA